MVEDRKRATYNWLLAHDFRKFNPTDRERARRLFEHALTLIPPGTELDQSSDSTLKYGDYLFNTITGVLTYNPPSNPINVSIRFRNLESRFMHITMGNADKIVDRFSLADFLSEGYSGDPSNLKFHASNIRKGLRSVEIPYQQQLVLGNITNVGYIMTLRERLYLYKELKINPVSLH